ncbi:unnamed protein product [Effrenium voratum]|uniref:Uncharacterized protein n=1 Tax=Effrenium voratum TaxID=2562239 RepID=A0AA36JTP1_9DINO|nr:unnamed protein product [Effrenium voratum]CAJ1452330.1 unnamed protein product [Effrenium voratum]
MSKQNGPEASPTSPQSASSVPREKSFGAMSAGVTSVGAKSEGEKSNGGMSVKSALSGTSPNGTRKDRKGNTIKKGQTSSHKLTFADQLGNKESLTEVHEVNDLWGDRGQKGCNCVIS